MWSLTPKVNKRNFCFIFFLIAILCKMQVLIVLIVFLILLGMHYIYFKNIILQMNSSDIIVYYAYNAYCWKCCVILQYGISIVIFYWL